MLLGSIWVSATPVCMDYTLGISLLANILPRKGVILHDKVWLEQ